MPCSLVSVDLEDIVGTHTINIQEGITKHRLDSSGSDSGQPDYTTPEVTEGKNLSSLIYDDAVKSIQNLEGCRVVGEIYAKKVPGNFHISYHGYEDIMNKLTSNGFNKVELSHRINFLDIGCCHHEVDITNRKFGGSTHLKNLNQVTKQDKEKKVFEYFLQVRFLII